MNTVPLKRVALAIPSHFAVWERVVGGILDHARSHGGWNLTRLPERLDPSINWLKSWPGDGAIVGVATQEDVALACTLKFPVVNLFTYLEAPGIPTVIVDHEAIGRLAVEHLLARRFRRFAYYGTSGIWYGQLRRKGFMEAIAKAGGECSVMEVPASIVEQHDWVGEDESLLAWLKSLRTPVGILASTDLRARMVLEACARLGLRVPEDVAVVGVDNDTVTCEFSQPTLSSVSRNDYAVGRRAAEMLDQLMAGEAVPRRPVLIEPDGVVARHSTDTLAIDDPHVAQAVTFIRQHVGEPFGVERLMESARLSRRRLEYRFRQSLGCSPYTFIAGLRVERARELLVDPTKRTLTQIALLSGFTELRRFRLVFRRIAGMDPAEFRRQNGPGVTDASDDA